MQRVEAPVVVSVSDLKKSPKAILNAAPGEAIAILNHNRIMAYMLPPHIYEAMLELLDDIKLAELIKTRSGEKRIPVNIDDL
jgi:antitoxin StbD